jgi:hypothetical protein
MLIRSSLSVERNFEGTNFMTATMIVHLRRPPIPTVIGLVAGIATAIWVGVAAKGVLPDLPHAPHNEQQLTSSPQLEISKTTSGTVSVAR